MLEISPVMFYKLLTNRLSPINLYLSGLQNVTCAILSETCKRLIRVTKLFHIWSTLHILHLATRHGKHFFTSQILFLMSIGRMLANADDATLEQKSSLFQFHIDVRDATLGPASNCEPALTIKVHNNYTCLQSTNSCQYNLFLCCLSMLFRLLSLLCHSKTFVSTLILQFFSFKKFILIWQFLQIQIQINEVKHLSTQETRNKILFVPIIHVHYILCYFVNNLVLTHTNIYSIQHYYLLRFSDEVKLTHGELLCI